MISAKKFINYLISNNLKFYSGVPDSLTQEICKFIESTANNGKNTIRFLPAANEGIAVSFAIGHYLASGTPGVVFMQNAGVGNAMNPLVSLASKSVFDIPLILLVGWRGQPGKSDEPQHMLQGRLTKNLLLEMEFNVEIISKETSIKKLKESKLLEKTISSNRKVAYLFTGGSLEE
jgi:phosphonopyruvate decarboxylase